MNDVVIFTVGFGVMAVVIMSAFIALIASDHPDEPRRWFNLMLIDFEIAVLIDHPPADFEITVVLLAISVFWPLNF
jgi:hypothetical protein